jgi:hypothetical protein
MGKQKPKIEGQTTQWPKEKGKKKDIKTLHKNKKNRATQTLLKSG